MERLHNKQRKLNLAMVLVFILGLTIFIGCNHFDRKGGKLVIIKNETKNVSLVDTVKVQQISDEIKKIKNDNNQTISVIFPWEHVASSMINYTESVIFDYDLCPFCKHGRIQLYFESPDWTWKKLCGRAGHMVICPICKTQDFHLEIMS